MKDPLVWVLLLFMSSAMGSYDTLATWMPKVLEMKGFPQALASLLPLGFFFAGPVIGWISDRLRDRKARLSPGVLRRIHRRDQLCPLPYLPSAFFWQGFPP
jgi:MFS family permease